MKKIITITAIMLSVVSFSAFAAEKSATKTDKTAPVEQQAEAEKAPAEGEAKAE